MAVEAAVGDLGKPFDEPFPEGGDIHHIGVEIGNRLLERRGHAHDAGHVLRAAPAAALLGAALDQDFRPDPLAAIEGAHALGAMELVRRQGEHVHPQRLHVHGDVPHGLDGVGVEEHALFMAELGDLPDGLNGADFVVHHHHAHQGGVVGDCGGHVGKAHHAVFMDIEIRHGEALLFQRLHGVEHGVVLKGRGDEVLLPFLGAKQCAGQKRLIVGLAAAAGEGNFRRLGIQALRHVGACLIENLPGALTHGVEAGGVAVVLLQAMEHGLTRRLMDGRGGRVICIDVHGQLSFISVSWSRDWRVTPESVSSSFSSRVRHSGSVLQMAARPQSPPLSEAQATGRRDPSVQRRMSAAVISEGSRLRQYPPSLPRWLKSSPARVSMATMASKYLGEMSCRAAISLMER